MNDPQRYVFNCHRLQIEASGPQDLLKALEDRFGEFPTEPSGKSDLQFEFRLVGSAEEHQVKRPAVPGRPFYQPEVGEATYFPSLDVCYLDYDQRVRVLCHPVSGHCEISMLEPESEQTWLASHPLFTLPLLEMLKRRGKFGLHAAGLAREGRSLLLPGTSGAGKSTLTIALLRSGFDFLGDDLALLESGERIEALAFPEQIDLTRNTAFFFPELAPLLNGEKRRGWPKYQLRAHDSYSSTVSWRTTPAAIVFPTLANTGKSVLVPLTSDEAFLELSASVFLTEKHSTQSHLGVLANLTQSVPVYRLLAGRDFDQTVSILGDLLL
jgi:hypothetical protein